MRHNKYLIDIHYLNTFVQTLCKKENYHGDINKAHDKPNN